MSFRLQYLNTTTKHWVDLAGATPDASSAVGSGDRPGRAARASS